MGEVCEMSKSTLYQFFVIDFNGNKIVMNGYVVTVIQDIIGKNFRKIYKMVTESGEYYVDDSKIIGLVG